MKSPIITTVFGAPVPDKGRKDYTPDNAKTRKPADTGDINNEARAEDRVFGVESRARWGGTGDDDSFSQLTADANAIENGGEEVDAAPARRGKRGK